MDRVHDLEKALAKAEGWLCVVLVLLMLLLAGYNVVYRNLLVPLQTHWAHSGPVPEAEPEVAAKAEDRPEQDAKGDAKEAGGFGGAFGSPADDEPDELDELEDEDEDAEGEAGGFGGAFGEEPEEADDEADDEGGDDGFGGAFGKPAEAGDPVDEDIEELLADNEFENLPEISAAGEDPEEAGAEPLGGPPEPGSFADRGAKFIDAIKLDWIDVLLRQLVIIVSFLGAAIATQRHKHINIDALSKVLKPEMKRWVDVATNLLAVSVCVILAVAGQRLVEIGREYPRKIVPFADEWVFQLMFPLGFGLLVIHFGIRLLESATGTSPPSSTHSTAATDPLESSGTRSGEHPATSAEGRAEEVSGRKDRVEEPEAPKPDEPDGEADDADQEDEEDKR